MITFLVSDITYGLCTWIQWAKITSKFIAIDNIYTYVITVDTTTKWYNSLMIWKSVRSLIVSCFLRINFGNFKHTH